MARGRTRRGGDYARVLAGLRRRAVDAAARRHLPHVDLHAGAVFRQPGGERQGHRAAQLTRQITELTSLLSLEKGKSKSRRGRARRAAGDALDAARGEHQAVGLGAVGRRGGQGRRGAHLRSHRGSRKAEEASPTRRSPRSICSTSSLLALRRQIAALNEALEASEKKDAESQTRIKDLGSRLNAALARQVQELQRYRSDFFGRLRELLKNRKDIRVVGDRFVFESEVLFPSGSDQLTPEGLATMDQLAAAIIELETRDPQGDRLGAAGRRPHRHPPDRQPDLPVQLGSVDGARDLGGALSDQPRRPAAAAGRGGYGEFRPLEPARTRRACSATAASS